MEKYPLASRLLLAIALLASAGCAFNPQTANIKPAVNVLSSNDGKGVTVAIRVVDERPSKSLGRRGTAYGAAAEITAAQDIAAVIQSEITAGLKQKGFNPVDESATADARLAIEVRLLEYSTSTGFWTGGVNIKSTLKGVATKGGKTYEKMYRTDKEERVMVVPTAETNEKWINGALSEVLTQLLDDNGLVMFLAQ